MKRVAPALLLGVAGCATTPKPPPRIAAVAPQPIIVPPKPPRPPEWQDMPYTPGRWRYSQDTAGSTAAYSESGTPAIVTLHCDHAHHEVELTRAGDGGSMTIRTSYGQQTIAFRARQTGRVIATFAATSPALDQIAFSRGRFSIAVPGLSDVYVPAWAEPARVIEDCRG
jgi:hypothetical protein